MSQRHQSNRRKSYGRRQHELAERRQRDAVPDVDADLEDLDPAVIADRFAFLDLRAPRVRYALGD